MQHNSMAGPSKERARRRKNSTGSVILACINQGSCRTLAVSVVHEIFHSLFCLLAAVISGVASLPR